MKRNKNLCLLLAVLLVSLLVLSGCGGSYDYSYKGESAMNGYPAEAPAAPMPEPEYPYYEDEGFAQDSMANGSLGGQQNLASRPNVKLIYTADLEVQTTEYEECNAALRKMVDELGGYFESSSTSNGSYYGSRNYRYASYTIRIPAENYAKLLTSIGGAFHVTNQNESVRDIGQAYAETEGHLATLKTKHERVLKLLSEASTMEDIISLENALSDCEYEIEYYSNQLNNYNSLIGYSTVYVNVSEVVRETGITAEDPSFGARLAAAFKEACSDFATGCEDFVLWVVENIFNLMVWAVILTVLILFRPIARLRAFSRRRAAEKDSKIKAKFFARQKKNEAPSAPEAESFEEKNE